MFCLFGIVFFTQVASILIITNQDAVNQGFCYLEDVKLYLDFECGPNVELLVRFSVEPSKNIRSETELLSCIRPKRRTWSCHDTKFMRGIINTWNNSLGINFRFNNSMYGGRRLRIKTTCNKIMVPEFIHLKACVSGFSSYTTLYNDSNFIIYCQHSSYNYSFSPIRIKLKGTDEEYGSCYRDFCSHKRCNKLPNGMQCTLPYTRENKYQCILDGALLNIDEPTMPEVMSSKSSSVPQTIATTPPKGSLTTGSITTTPEGRLTTLSCQDNTLTTQESPTSKSTMVSPQKGTTDRATHLPEIDATSEVPGKSTDKDASGIQRSLMKANTFLIISVLFLIHVFYYLLL